MAQEIAQIVLKEGEKITIISGTYGKYEYQNNECVIATMKIHTNFMSNGVWTIWKRKGNSMSARIPITNATRRLYCRSFLEGTTTMSSLLEFSSRGWIAHALIKYDAEATVIASSFHGFALEFIRFQ
uniref:Jacalin-type lectin domain-containing protein n=1 Tax=Chenopodium quinoa TaxID=63459 RepID=A0A803MAE2_CHEQI